MTGCTRSGVSLFKICIRGVCRRDGCRLRPSFSGHPFPAIPGRGESLYIQGRCLRRQDLGHPFFWFPQRAFAVCARAVGSGLPLRKCNTGTSRDPWAAGIPGGYGKAGERLQSPSGCRGGRTACGKREGCQRVVVTGRGARPSGHGLGRECISPLIGVFVIHEHVGQPGKGQTAGNHGRCKDDFIDEHNGNLRLPLCLAFAVPCGVRRCRGREPSGVWDGAAGN